MKKRLITFTLSGISGLVIGYFLGLWGILLAPFYAVAFVYISEKLNRKQVWK